MSKTKVKENIKKQKEYFIVSGKNCVIPFHTLLKNDKYEKYNFFKITLASKKVYSRIIGTICSTNNEVLNFDTKVGDEFIYKYLVLKMELDEGKYNNKKELFVTNMLRSLFTVELLGMVERFVDSKYNTKIDSKYEENKGKKYEEGPMFVERHYKVLYQLTVLIRLAILICIQFVQRNPQDDITIFLKDITISILKYVESGKNMNIYHKIYRLVEKNVNTRKNTDNYGLSLQEIYGITIGTIIDDVINKLLITIVPKMDFDGEIISLISVVVKTHLDTFLLRGKFAFTAHSIASDDLDGTANGEDAGNETELYDSYNTRKDEKLSLLRQVLPSFTIRNIEELYQIEYSPGEFEYYLSTLEKNSLQELLVSQVFSKDFGGTDNVYGCNKVEFAKLCVILAKRMRRYDINLLADYMTAKKDSTILTRYQYKNINKKLQANPKYEEVLKKYKNVQNLFINKITAKIERNPMMENLILILNNNYNKNTFLATDNGSPLSKSDDIIIDEMLKMYSLLIY